MKYIIVAWTKDEEDKPCWEILHYSHKINDVKTWYDKFKITHPNCQLMIDYHEATSLESKESIMASFSSFLDELIK